MYVASGIHAWYTAASFNVTSTVWRDVSGNGRNGAASGGGFSVGAVAGFGSVAGTVPYVQGATTASAVVFATMPAAYTICTLSRYGSTTTATNKRIIASQSINFVHGHYAGQAGQAYYSTSFLSTVCVQVRPAV